MTGLTGATSGTTGAIEWPDGDNTWELESICNMSPDSMLLINEAKGELSHLFTSLLWTNGDERNTSICFGTLYLQEKNHHELKDTLSNESTFKIFNNSPDLLNP